jgi:hypothetical protein
MDKREKRRKIIIDLKVSVILSLIAFVVIFIIVFIYSKLKGIPLLQNANMFYYGFGALALAVAVPQLWKRNEDSKIRKARRLNPLYGFNDWFQSPYEEKAMLESFEEHKGEGFWTGILIIIFALMLFLYGFIFEKIYYMGL